MQTAFKSLIAVASGSVAALAFASGASALTLVQTQTFDFDPGPTEIPTVWTRSAAVDKWSGPGSLVKVEVELLGTATSQLTVSATTASPVTVRRSLSFIGASIGFSGLPGVSSDPLEIIPQGTLGTGNQVIPGNGTANYGPINGEDSLFEELFTGLSPYEGAGSIPVSVIGEGLASLT